MTAHEYLSTGCLHGEHAYCQAKTGAVGIKRPGECKFCGAPCTCPCHQQPKHETDVQKIKRLERALRREKRRSAAANTRADASKAYADDVQRRLYTISRSVNAAARAVNLRVKGEQ